MDVLLVGRLRVTDSRLQKCQSFGAPVRFERCTRDITDNVSLEGQQLRYCGLGVDYDDVIIHGNPGEMKVSDVCVKP